ncbi:hypothetical protein GCM10018954_081000 [Kutzneria kofuensis]
MQTADPNRPLLSNADGSVVTSGAEMLGRLVAQVTLPVRWDLCMDTLARAGVTTTIELAPGGALTGLVKRQLKDVVTTPIAIKTRRTWTRQWRRCPYERACERVVQRRASANVDTER